MLQIESLRSYRATLVPRGVDPTDAQTKADQRALPTIQVKAVNGDIAALAAHWASGLPVIEVCRVEGGAA